MKMSKRQIIVLVINLIAKLLLSNLLREVILDVPIFIWEIPFTVLFAANTGSQLIVVNLVDQLSKIEKELADVKKAGGQGDGSKPLKKS